MSKTIVINKIPVEVSTPYEAGHQITEAEAKALNQVRAENVANNNRAKLKEILGDAGEPTKEMVKEAQKIISAYDADYQFTLASVGGGRTRLDPVEKEARSIATAVLMNALREKGQAKKDWIEANGGEEAGKEAWANKVAEVAAMPAIVEKAEKTVKQRQGLSDLEVSL